METYSSGTDNNGMKYMTTIIKNGGFIEAATTYSTRADGKKIKIEKNAPIKDAMKSSIADLVRIDRFNQNNGIEYLHEDGSEVRELALQGVYDIRESGCGDISLPSKIRRKVLSGECGTRASSLMQLIY
jgi:hypothetical protein